MSNLARVEPKVTTLARPESGPLLAARHNVQRAPELRSVFAQARTEQWTAEKLAEKLLPGLSERVEGSSEQIGQVARYLADEYTQIGDAMLLISTETGKAIARITDEDIWQPPAVPREGGGMAKPLPRLRPDLEGFLVEWAFNTSRENQIKDRLAKRIHQTDLLREAGDPRLLCTTKSGRKRIIEAIEDSLPVLLPEGCGGFLGTVLGRFEFAPMPPSTLPPLMQCVGLSRVQYRINDATGFNLFYNHYNALLANIGMDWGRDILRTLALAAHHQAPVNKVSCEKMADWFPPSGMWVADPNTATALSSRFVAPIEGAPPIHLSDAKEMGFVCIDPDGFGCQSREYHDRWEIVAKFTYTIHTDFEGLTPYDIEGVPATGLAVEILR